MKSRQDDDFDVRRLHVNSRNRHDPIEERDAHVLHVGITRTSDPSYEVEAAGGVTYGERLLAVAVLAKAAEDAVKWLHLKKPTNAMKKERNVGQWARCCENVKGQKKGRCRCDPRNPEHEFRPASTMDSSKAEEWLRETMIGEDVGTAGGWVDVCGADSTAFRREIMSAIENGVMPNGTGSYAAESAYSAEVTR